MTLSYPVLRTTRLSLGSLMTHFKFLWAAWITKLIPAEKDTLTQGVLDQQGRRFPPQFDLYADLLEHLLRAVAARVPALYHTTTAPRSVEYKQNLTTDTTANGRRREHYPTNGGWCLGDKAKSDDRAISGAEAEGRFQPVGHQFSAWLVREPPALHQAGATADLRPL
jgi:hypothetical protein